MKHKRPKVLKDFTAIMKAHVGMHEDKDCIILLLFPKAEKGTRLFEITLKPIGKEVK